MPAKTSKHKSLVRTLRLSISQETRNNLHKSRLDYGNPDVIFLQNLIINTVNKAKHFPVSLIL